ncbi:hypothetical protein A9Q84_03605 [Halobacteriovorax marinus]|uniref:Uncharacterized protein n=1 Tax=Halobacteriovorax marinus TaxID=97084 RepID=A0A1Y5FA18_9BACT|nr:hypothetical protein A9Q84_03605 [Halobacteriovorax marinus]
MKKIILLISILLVPCSTLGYSFFKIKPNDIKLSSESFRRYVRPQLKSIVSEYFHVLKKVSPETEPIISLRRNILSISKMTRNYVTSCSNLNAEGLSNCPNKVQQISHLLKQYEKNLYKKLENFSLIGSEIEDALSYQKLLRNLITSLAAINHHLEEYRILNGTDFEKYATSFDEINLLVEKSLAEINLKMNILVPLKLKNEFETIWISFILPIQEMVVLKNSKTFLITHLERLNIDWNSFNKNMTKGNYNIVLSKIKVTKIMHNRWNAVLKIILRK